MRTVSTKPTDHTLSGKGPLSSPEGRLLGTTATLTLQGRRANIDGPGTLWVVQWLKNHLPVQGTQVRSLVREESTCHGATKPMHHN